MKKRKIAVFSNGWNDDYLDFALEGIKNRAREDNIDVFIFLDYTSYDKSKEDIYGELNILNLPRLSDFDGVLLLGNTLNNAGENAILRKKILDTKVPAVCLEYQLNDISCIRTDNINGMKELTEHLITVHDVKDIFWIGGPADNADNIERYTAMVDTMSEHGLTFDPSKVFEGCWSYAIVEDKLPAIVSDMDKLPDAFVCANDSMALATCTILDRAGISVPGDVIVTGFDNLMSGNHFSPILTSVDRGWEARSYQAVDALIKLIDGVSNKVDKIYHSKFDKGESCGCSMGDAGIKLHHEARTRAFHLPVERTIFDWHLMDIDESVSGVKKADDIFGSFKKIFEDRHSYEGDDFFICLDRRFLDSMTTDTPCGIEGYTDDIDVIYGMKDGKTVARHTISATDLVPCYDSGSPSTSMYLFIPLHIFENCLGYYVSKDNVKTIKDFYVNSLTKHIEPRT